MQIMKIKGTIEVACINKKSSSKYLLLLSNATLIDLENNRFEEKEKVWIPFNQKALLNLFFSKKNECIEVFAAYNTGKENSMLYVQELIDIIPNHKLGFLSFAEHLQELLKDKIVCRDFKQGDFAFALSDYNPIMHIQQEVYPFLLIITKFNLDSDPPQAKGMISGVYDWFEISNELKNSEIFRVNTYNEFKDLMDFIPTFDKDSCLTFYKDL